MLVSSKVFYTVARNSSNLKSWPKYARGNWIPKVPKPPKIDHAGDIDMSLPKINMSSPLPSLANSELLKGADESVVRLTSLEYAHSEMSNNYLMQELVGKFQRYEGDNASLEVRVAKATYFIRKYASLCNENTADKVAKVKLLRAISRRYHLLSRLRNENYGRFQFCVKELGIRWQHSLELPEEKRKPTKKELRIKSVKEEADNIKAERLEVLQEKYKNELEALRKEKDESLKQVAQSMKMFNITDDDIFFQDGAVKPADLEETVAEKQREEWEEAEKKNIVRWMRVIRRPEPNMGFFTADLLRSSGKV